MSIIVPLELPGVSSLSYPKTKNEEEEKEKRKRNKKVVNKKIKLSALLSSIGGIENDIHRPMYGKKYIQLFQLTLSDQSFKPTRQGRMAVWVEVEPAAARSEY